MEKHKVRGNASIIKEQREIGKQLFLVNILHYENDRVQEGGYSFLSRDTLAAWASMTKDELDHFIDACSALDPFNMAAEAAKKCCRNDTFKSEKGALCFVLSTYYRMGDLFATSLDIDKFEESCKKFSEYNYQRYCEKHKEYPVDEAYATPEVFEEAMRFYLKYFVALIKNILSEGYDWDVIISMTRKDITEERYHSLVRAFMKEIDDECSKL